MRLMLNRETRTFVLGFACVAGLLFCTNAYADTFSFSITGPGITASGIFTTAAEVSGTFLITGLTDTRNGQAMTLLGPNDFAGNDNLLYATAPLFDFAGISYEVGGIDYNLQYDSASDSAPFIGYGEFASTGQWVKVDFAASSMPSLPGRS